jgi:hypothetical protein
MRLSISIPALILCLCMGCASYGGRGLIPGIATQADTRAVMGQPAAIYPAAPGAGYAESWEYPHQPMGRQTYMVRFDAAGKVLRVDQVLDLKNLTALRYGIDTTQTVRQVFGKPGQISGPHRIYGGPIWDYFAYDGQRRIIISVSFDAAGKLRAAGEVPDPSDQAPIQAM